MKCCQCPNPAYHIYRNDEGGENPLCLHCSKLHQELVSLQLDRYATMINMTYDSIESSVGLPGAFPRVPVRGSKPNINVNTGIQAMNSSINAPVTQGDGNTIGMGHAKVAGQDLTEHDDARRQVLEHAVALIPTSTDPADRAEVLDLLDRASKHEDDLKFVSRVRGALSILSDGAQLLLKLAEACAPLLPLIPALASLVG